MTPLQRSLETEPIDGSWMEVDSLPTETSHLIEDTSISDCDEEGETLSDFEDHHLDLLKKYSSMIPDRFKSSFSSEVAINPVRHVNCRSLFDRSDVFQIVHRGETNGESEIPHFSINMGECPRCSETAITDGFKEDKKLQREIKAFCQRVLEKHDLTIQQKRRVEIELADQKERQLTTADKDQPIFSNQVELTRLPVCGSGKEYRKNAVKHLSNLDLNLGLC